ncbi:hypothetical protein [Marinobacter changyiensis]|nr:hypothetical protein [Marinobacter changyiensis]
MARVSGVRKLLRLLGLGVLQEPQSESSDGFIGVTIGSDSVILGDI